MVTNTASFSPLILMADPTLGNGLGHTFSLLLAQLFCEGHLRDQVVLGRVPAEALETV
jgi:hypothetical protein